MWQNKLHAYVHFVWGTRDRLPIISSSVERSLYRYIESVCRQNQCLVLAMGGTENHVHLFVRLSSAVSLGNLMKQVKGGSSYFMTKELSSPFEWQRGYGAFSVSLRYKQKVMDYVCNQKRHHADNTLWDGAETYEQVWIDEEA
jgi:REP element-mobilizing transposase RayT